ncbi:hypothetical protein GmHk_14G041645 [Glycine max]|nr:hypothetical protein GmHk_14G041645 [Glycine max]
MAQKKSTPITPTTSRRSKVAIPSKKRKEISSSDSDDDVELDVPDIKRAKTSGKKVPGNVPDAPLDNISFHSIGNVERWKFVYQRRLALERELGRDALDCKEIMDLITAAGLLKTVTKLGDCYEKSFAVKLPIAFPTVLCGIMLSQHPNILNYTDSVMKRESPLSLHYKLFEGTHVPDIVSTSGKAAASGAVSKDALIAELKDTCKVLEATIKAITEKKMELERLIKRLTDRLSFTTANWRCYGSALIISLKPQSQVFISLIQKLI